MSKIVLFFCFFSCALANIQGQSLQTNAPINWPLKNESKIPTALIFLSAVCPCSHSHLAHIRKLKDDFPNVKFIGVHANQDESLEVSKKYFAANPLPFEVIQDAKAALANEWKAYKTPHAFLFSSKGELVYAGGVTDSSLATTAKQFFLQSALADITQGRSVKVKQGRTLGCVISRK